MPAWCSTSGATELAVCGGAGIIDIVDVAFRDPVPPLIDVCSAVPRLIVTAVWQQVMTDASVRRNPFADVRMGSGVHAGFPTGRTTISVVSTSVG